MGFYDTIAEYYDSIFPVGDDSLEFIKNTAGPPPARILDVACGTGGYAVGLAQAGYRVSAADLNGEMVARAAAKALALSLKPDLHVCDMKKLDKCFAGSFDCIFCIGNSIVHLGNTEEIKEAVSVMHRLLREGGSLIIQTINYDRIIKRGITELPVIKNEEAGVEFIRNYSYREGSRHVGFDTVLRYCRKGETGVLENSIDLYALTSGETIRLLTEAGFKSPELFGDFRGAAYGEDSFLLVSRSVK